MKSCEFCGESVANNRRFCSIKHQREYLYLEMKRTGKFGRHSLRRFLIERQNGNCLCGISEWNGKKIGLELEHKDGNSENDDLNNLCMLCPNCHSQTPTFKNRNKGNGRYARRVRYASGKSY